MKKLKTLILLFTLLGMLPVWAEGTLYTIRTNSFDCDFCVYDLEQKFMKIKGVKEFDTDVDGLLFVKTDKTLKLNKDKIKKMLIDNGFDYLGMTEKQYE